MSCSSGCGGGLCRMLKTCSFVGHTHISLSLSISIYLSIYRNFLVCSSLLAVLFGQSPSIQRAARRPVKSGVRALELPEIHIHIRIALESLFHRIGRKGRIWQPHLRICMVAMFCPFGLFCEISISLLSLQKQQKAAPNLFQRGGKYGKYELVST